MRKLNKDGNGAKEHLYIIEEMAKKVNDIFETYIKAFVERDENKIYILLACDDEIDEMRVDIVKEIIDFMKENPENVFGGSIILLLSKKLK